jgi:hypothetical protein
MQNAGRNTALFHQLGAILKMLRENGVDVIALKGVDLAENVYDHIALRLMSDADLLIRREHVTRVSELMLAAGWRFGGGLDHHLKRHYHISFASPNETQFIEMHWGFVRPESPFIFDIGKIWERAVPTPIAGVDILKLSIEDGLLYLCVHLASNHGFRSGLPALYDVAATIEKQKDAINWNALFEITAATGGQRCVALSLRLAKDWLAAPIPEDVLELFCDLEGFSERLELVSKLILEHTPMSSDLAKLWGGKGLKEKTAAVLRNVFPPPGILAHDYPQHVNSPRIFLYYPPHFFKLFRKYSGTVGQIIRKDPEMMARVARENEADALRDWLESPK